MFLQFLNIWVLRDYLQHDLKIFGAKVKIDLERLIDDFVFICLFVGNDFLPHVPSLEISEVNLERVEHFLRIHVLVDGYSLPLASLQREMNSHLWDAVEVEQKTGSNQGSEYHTIPYHTGIRISCRYGMYRAVLSCSEHTNIQYTKVKRYVEGICWVMHYYYQGVCSWQWFVLSPSTVEGEDRSFLGHQRVHLKLPWPTMLPSIAFVVIAVTVQSFLRPYYCHS
ncbi:hypothetical protein B296_00020590 [Ensete ventricosum]|uniref:Xrn1 helical domain-containing protein n=1 Tax=Ensete ventricosum TaxID=4639 RepID=A0A427AHU1_ENSVE|nr:hypothetical protein B296_00020590 [Ensete ventricosum]